ncbi:hypothetical protein [Plantibacter sp. CFBP 13570]|uniref:hypothetical protein n=1 Tax=Plantibacter sp. CFBP 13570 TaxID=2775272 RepID=UPI001930DB86|nr:hypothetical protein [Plantibacter sp. CFBP 13570]MBD8535568.1 hypothetical protein [Plantibacter sp. CFBP 13570]
MVDVEKRGTIAVEDRLSLCPHLASYIDTRDTTPLTDGFIQVYNSLSHSNADTAGRLDVQVKGRTASGKLAPTSFPMSRTDLEAFRRHGTVLLFVAHVWPNGSWHGGLKYAILAPFTVGMFLSEMKKRAKSFSVPLQDLPEDPQAIESIVGIALKTQKQSFFLDSAIDLEGSRSFTINSARELNLDEPQVISSRTGDFAIEVENQDGVILPLNGEIHIFPASYTERPLGSSVRCGDTTYDTPTIRQTDASHYELKLSSGLHLTHSMGDGASHAGTTSLNLVANLAERVKDIDLFLALASGEPFFVNDQEFTLKMNKPQKHAELRSVRARLEDLLDLFDRLHVDPALIDLDDITDAQHATLRELGGAMRSEWGLSIEKTAHVNVEVGSWRLVVLLIRDEKTGAALPLSLFDPNSRDQFKLYRSDESGQSVEARATIYDAYADQDLSMILNLNLSSVVDAYQSISDVENVAWMANRFVLQLIHSADQSSARRQEFLDAADALNGWLAESDSEAVHTALNRFQIQARRPSGLSADHRASIRALRRQILRTHDASPMQEAGCAILLGDADDVQDCLGRLSQREREELESYPIWSLVDSQDPAALEQSALSL